MTAAALVRNLVDEQTKTFIWTMHMEGPEGFAKSASSVILTNSDRKSSNASGAAAGRLYLAVDAEGWRDLPGPITQRQLGGARHQFD